MDTLVLREAPDVFAPFVQINRGQRLRFYPNAEQRRLLAQVFGHARYVYNRALSEKQSAWNEQGETLSYCDLSKRLTAWKRDAQTAWLKDVCASPLVQSLRHLDRAYKDFFEGKSKYPSFKKRTHKQSATYQLDQRHVDRNFNYGRGILILPRLGRLKLRWPRKDKRPIEGIPKMVTVTKEPSGAYYVSFMTQECIRPYGKEGVRPVCGIDLGLKSLFMDDAGNAFGALRPLREHLRKLKKAQRALARKQKGSKRWQAQKLKVARIHARVKNIRLDTLHKITTQLIRENQALGVESLHVAGMLRNHKLARVIADAGLGAFLRLLRYKAEWHGRTLVAADRWYPSSKRCNVCGHKLNDLKLSTREWDCPDCGTHHDRDRNAAINLRKLAESQLEALALETDTGG